jgi:hypothetical protein
VSPKIFKELRQPDNYKGKCGVCEFRYVCGGSRSRSRTFAVTDEHRESEPFCVYVPQAMRKNIFLLSIRINYHKQNLYNNTKKVTLAYKSRGYLF